MSYTDLLPHLVHNSLVAPVPMKPIEPPYPRGYDPNAKCDYHAGGVGHSTENCRALKFKVQDLLNAKWLNFKEESPNVGSNPLPGHGASRSGVNMVKEYSGRLLVQNVADVKTPMKRIFEELCKVGAIEEDWDIGKEVMCAIHPDAEHSIERCEEFKEILQSLIDSQLVQISCIKDEREVNMVKESENAHNQGIPSVPTPLTVHRNQNIHAPTICRPRPITIQVPSPFPYKNSKAVLWRYNVQVCVDNVQSNQAELPICSGAPAVTNVSGVGGITRSGRIYTPKDLQEEKEREVQKGNGEKGKEKDKEGIVRKEEHKRAVTDEEASEFLKFVKQNEYKVVDQLSQTPAKIFVLSLLLSSEPHRKALLRILNEAHVSHDITINKFDGIIGSIRAINYFTFTDDEIPSEGLGHNKALHISVKCHDHIMARVLVDNGSSLNVIPKSTLSKLPYDGSHMRPSSMIVRAFDGTRREVVGEIELPIQIGPFTFEILFQVMDIMPTYSCLLGRPWIHTIGAVPSTLHQKVKFIVDNKLIIISGEEDMLVSKPSSTPYIEAAEEALETAFQTFEIANASYAREGAPIVGPHLSKASLMVAKTMLEKGYQYGRGLGRTMKGTVDVLHLYKNKERFGLGYKPTPADRRRVAEEKREKRLARLENRESTIQGIPICDIRQSFRSARLVFADQVAVIREENISDRINDAGSLVYPCAPDTELNNWKIIEFPVVLSSVSK